MAFAAPSYIIAARRTAIGRVGGLHRTRRIEDLAAPVVAAVVEDSRLPAERVEELIVGNALQGGNPARIIALAAGLPDSAAAMTVDRQCASGLDAILTACRLVGAGDASVIVAGGAESVSTAPWRIAKPKSLYQTPHFIGVEPLAEERTEEIQPYEAAEALSRKLNITRDQQDDWALRSHLRAQAARDSRTFVGEIVPLRSNPEEARDQSATEPEAKDLADLSPFLAPDGTLTPGNTSLIHDGAAFVLVVSEAVWKELGEPPALRLLATASQGVAPEEEAGAPIAAARKLYGRLNGFDTGSIGVVELSESSAAQAIAFATALGYPEGILNPDGGAVVRGHPLAASGAVLVVRLFTRMVRERGARGGSRPQHGIAALGAHGGLGVAALFEATASGGA